MAFNSMKFFVVAGFSLILSIFSVNAFATDPPEKGSKFRPGDVLMEHILDAHEFHVINIGEREIAFPLPVILYSPAPGRGFTAFMSSRFEEGPNGVHEGYKIAEGKIRAVDANGNEEEGVKVYDLSITRNVAQMLIALIILVLVLTSVARKYKRNGSNTAPSGFQNAIEPVITFIRDEVGKSTLGHKYEKYMPYLLTVFFFILINNIFGLLPGSANVTGNIAFTAVLGVISFIVIIFSTNSHYWGHIFNPPGVPFLVKCILVPVEFIGIFTKPFALIIRLFANMVAGHMIITCLILLIFIFGIMSAYAGYGFSIVSMAFTIFIYLIEILVAFIQAFIFTNLTAVFISQAIENTHEGHDDAVII